VKSSVTPPQKLKLGGIFIFFGTHYALFCEITQSAHPSFKAVGAIDCGKFLLVTPLLYYVDFRLGAGAFPLAAYR